MKNTQKGIGTVGIIAALAVVIIAGGAWYISTSQNTSKPSEVMEEGQESAMMDASGDEGSAQGSEGAMMDSEGNMEDEEAMMENGYMGEMLAGSSERPLLEFDQADYEKAVANNKLIVLYFYANWCPVCKEEFPKMQAAFNDLTEGDVVGFRVNYNDDTVTAEEEALAREFGVAYQHTKVILQGDERVLKSPESWEEERYLNEITSNAMMTQ